MGSSPGLGVPFVPPGGLWGHLRRGAWAWAISAWQVPPGASQVPPSFSLKSSQGFPLTSPLIFPNSSPGSPSGPS